MGIKSDNYEKLGKFYLGRTYDTKNKEIKDELLLYDSKDLVTHGVVLGMTGSGKTGLCISLLEEAAMDNIPSIIIDPKGDISNLLLSFPELSPGDFLPWVNEDEARKKGLSLDEYSNKVSNTWKEGLSSWGQTGERIKEFKSKVDMSIYTPGSNAGIPVSILSSFNVPEFETLNNSEAFAQRVESTVSSILSLIGMEEDSIQSSEHVLISNIFSSLWKNGKDLTIEDLIRYIQIPPFNKIGIMDLEVVCPEKKRLEIAMKLNNLLGSLGFSNWVNGDPINIKKMLHTESGKPKISIFSIAHLNDKDRMFFVSLLLNQMLGWMRTQSGTTSLRAIFYMDEIYGYLPPSSMPPSKKPIMTMLKQARAFGLGVLLATQNPVDLDYKALSNIGTWWIGRLQTEGDKNRVLDGLERNALSSKSVFTRKNLEKLLSNLGSRVFLMNNVHEDEPSVFHVRWVMSYLRGPIGSNKIKKLMDHKKTNNIEKKPQNNDFNKKKELSSKAELNDNTNKLYSKTIPKLPKGVKEYFFPISLGDGLSNYSKNSVENKVHYLPAILRVGRIKYNNSAKKIHGEIITNSISLIDLRSGDVNWKDNFDFLEEIKISQLRDSPANNYLLPNIPQSMLQTNFWSSLEDDWVDYLYQNSKVEVYKSNISDLYSKVGESEVDFRIRLDHIGREARDNQIDILREKYNKKILSIENKINRLTYKAQEQADQASRAKIDTAIRIGGTILSVILGRRIVSSSRSSMSGVSRSWKEQRDVERVKKEIEKCKEELEALERECEKEIIDFQDSINPQNQNLEKYTLTPLKRNCNSELVGIVWIPDYMI